MIASYVGVDGQERAFDVACLNDFNALVEEARCSVLLEHENGSSIAFSAGESTAFLVWTDPLGFVYSWQGDRADGLCCVQAYLATGWPRSDRLRFTSDGI